MAVATASLPRAFMVRCETTTTGSMRAWHGQCIRSWRNAASPGAEDLRRDAYCACDPHPVTVSKP
jgi:hypothetical protein